MGPRLAPVVGLRLPAGWKVGTRDLAYGLPAPRRDGRPMDAGGLLHLLEEFGFHQERDKMHRGGDGRVDAPTRRTADAPRPCWSMRACRAVSAAAKAPSIWSTAWAGRASGPGRPRVP
jgi:hypothetical protein